MQPIRYLPSLAVVGLLALGWSGVSSWAQSAAPSTPPAGAAADTPAAATVTWDLINEYPASALTGEGDAFFAAAVARRTSGRVVIRPLPEAKSGLRTRDHLKAVADGRFAMASSFGGALDADSPIFLLSSLPFITGSAADARALYEAALPLYEALFAARGQKLLFVSPWPSSGLWSASAADSPAALRTLKIRTYDQTGTAVFGQVAASASVISFADLTPKLQSGEINAVLSSGDGGAGRQLWRYLRHFADINYALPLSFGTVSLAAWSALDDSPRAQVLEAGRETTAHQWAALAERGEQNFTRMRENGVTIESRPPASVMDALRGAATPSVENWKARAGDDARKVLEAYLKSSR